MPIRKSFLIGFSCLFPLLHASAQATEAAPDSDRVISVELNNAQALEGACRLSFLIRNDLGVPLETMGIEIVMLDKKGLAQDLMVLSTGALSQGKRRLRQFDLPDVDCDALSEILINDVSDCQAEGMTASGCLAALRPSSRAKIKLGL
ncbi:hypothetical protein [uncultured Cohaesibacter sp.]|uniref:hypothetical protein n=1 Tax=uncultured Cohaesibacter sp. TaxID=1002546 RepID=UPI002AAC0785|nr:hypothetical protein [uncultured Cohaesibacter sp.]